MKGSVCNIGRTKSLLDFFEKALMLGCDEQRYGAAVAAQLAVVQGVFRPVGQAFVVGLVHGLAGDLPSTRCRERATCSSRSRQCLAPRWTWSALQPCRHSVRRSQLTLKQDYMARPTAATDGRGVRMCSSPSPPASNG